LETIQTEKAISLLVVVLHQNNIILFFKNLFFLYQNSLKIQKIILYFYENTFLTQKQIIKGNSLCL
jgi:hypothetical protein